MTIERILLVLLMGVLAGVVVWWFDATLRNESERRRQREVEVDMSDALYDYYGGAYPKEVTDKMSAEFIEKQKIQGSSYE
jgi:hypothetical protein